MARKSPRYTLFSFTFELYRKENDIFMKKKAIRIFAWFTVIFSVISILLMLLWALNFVTLTELQLNMIILSDAICYGIVLALCICPKIEQK